MGYYFSNSLKTLTHWQSNKKGEDLESFPRGFMFYGLISDGVSYYFPFIVWDNISELTDAQVHPNLTRKGFAFQFDPANLSPIASAIQQDADKKNTFYRAIYQLDNEGLCKWATKTMRHDGPIVVNNQEIESGQTVGIALPVFNIYLLVQGKCSSDKVSNMPSWMNAYENSDKVYDDSTDSTRDFAAALKPELFQSSGKAKKGTITIKTGYKDGIDKHTMFGCHKFYDEQPNYYSGGQYYSSQLFSVGCANKGMPLCGGGSIVQSGVRYKALNVGGSDIGGYPTAGMERHNVDGGYYDYYITREPVKYSLTHGILWKRQE